MPWEKKARQVGLSRLLCIDPAGLHCSESVAWVWPSLELLVTHTHTQQREEKDSVAEC
jgi:hypothetical protein